MPSSRRGRPPTRSADRRGLKSTDTGVRLLTAMAAADGPLGLTELASRIDAGVSTAHRHLAGFADVGLVQQDQAGGRYDLGPLALRIGLAALARLDVVSLAESHLRGLAAETGFTALLSVWSDRGPTVVRWQRAALPFVTSLSLGSVLPVTRSATGLVFLAFLPASVTALAVGREQGGPVDAGLLARCRASRLAAVDGTVIPGLRAVASPVLDLQSEAAAVITLIGADDALADDDSLTRDSLRQATAALSVALGWRQDED